MEGIQVRDKFPLKHVILLAIPMMFVAFYFWTTSRYPELSGKAILGSNSPLSDLGFHPLVEIEDDFTFTQKIFWGTINWMSTNKKGMTFSFLFGAFLISMLPLLQRFNFKNRFQSSFLGLIIGAPLGVCVNCAAPIAQSLHVAGAKLPTVLATLIASPTLNIVVLVMMLSMFPLYLVGLKVGFTLLYILVVIPLSCRFFFNEEELRKPIPEDGSFKHKFSVSVDMPPSDQGWGAAILWAVQSYFKSLFLLVKIALPLMILAGFLGTVAITVLPWDELQTLDVAEMSVLGLLTFIGIAFFGVILPAPMAFDAVFSSVLLQTGMPIAYVAVFLFTLGSFSIYAFFIIWRSISLRLAVFMFLMTMVLGICVGGLSYVFEQYYYQTASRMISTTKIAAVDPVDETDIFLERSDPVYALEDIRSNVEPVVFSDEAGLSVSLNITVQSAEFLPSSGGADGKFLRFSGEELGLLQPYTISYLSGLADMVPRLTQAVAAGDVHNDGWIDLLVMGDAEVYPNLVLYSNINGQRFMRQELPMPDKLRDVVNVGLVDLNGDGWLDIVFSTFDGENYRIFSDGGSFDAERMALLIPKQDAVTVSLGFADIEGDGDMDIFLGNWKAGTHFIGVDGSENHILKNNGDVSFQLETLQGDSGETLTSLFHDFNGDGLPDLYVGNDYIDGRYSDGLYFGDGQGGLRPATAEELQMYEGAQSTMSVDVGDFNNDLKPDYFLGQIAFTESFVSKWGSVSDYSIDYGEYCGRMYSKGSEEFSKCQGEFSYRHALVRASHFIGDACSSVEDDARRLGCLKHYVNHKNACSFHISGRQKMADLSADLSQRYSSFCQGIEQAYEGYLAKEDAYFEHLDQRKLHASNASLRNILLTQNDEDNSTYRDVAKALHTALGGWTWNSKFADLNNDGWQDLYVANGFNVSFSLFSNLFYENQSGDFFLNKTYESSLEDFTPTAAYTYIDYDRDGDIDIISFPTDAPIAVFQNNMAENGSIIISLRDKTTQNTRGIGAKVILTLIDDGGNESKQVRYIKASGGYKSQDAAFAHFGLGKNKIKAIEVVWPDGGMSDVNGDISKQKQYVVTRVGE